MIAVAGGEVAKQRVWNSHLESLIRWTTGELQNREMKAGLGRKAIALRVPNQTGLEENLARLGIVDILLETRMQEETGEEMIGWKAIRRPGNKEMGKTDGSGIRIIEHRGTTRTTGKEILLSGEMKAHAPKAHRGDLEKTVPPPQEMPMVLGAVGVAVDRSAEALVGRGMQLQGIETDPGNLVAVDRSAEVPVGRGMQLQGIETDPGNLMAVDRSAEVLVGRGMQLQGIETDPGNLMESGGEVERSPVTLVVKDFQGEVGGKAMPDNLITIHQRKNKAQMVLRLSRKGEGSFRRSVD